MTQTSKRILCVVVPVYNESETINEFHNRLFRALIKLRISEWDFQIIFVNDGSSDDTMEKLLMIQEMGSSIETSIISLSRNFGHQEAVWAGIENSPRHSCVLVMDADLQDPPELIEEFIVGLENNDIVMGKRRSRKDSFGKKLFARLFYFILGNLSDGVVMADVGDFWALSERAKKTLLRYPEELKFLRGLITVIGFPTKVIFYDRDVRFAGKTHYSIIRMIKLAIAGMTGFTIKPLIYTVYAAIGVSAVLFPTVLFLAYSRITGTSQISPGLTFVGIVVIMSIALLFIVQSVIALYVARIAIEVKRRPVYVLDTVQNRRAKA